MLIEYKQYEPSGGGVTVMYNHRRYREQTETQFNNAAVEETNAQIERVRRLLQKSKGLALALESVFEFGKDQFSLTDQRLQEQYNELKASINQP